MYSYTRSGEQHSIKLTCSDFLLNGYAVRGNCNVFEYILIYFQLSLPRLESDALFIGCWKISSYTCSIYFMSNTAAYMVLLCKLVHDQ